MKVLFFKLSLIFLLILFSELTAIVVAQEQEQAYQTETGQEGLSSQAEAAGEPVSSVISPVLEIKRLETKEPMYSLELRDVDIGDLFRVLAHDYKLNLMIDKDAQGKITASLTNVSLEEALETIAESQNLILKKKGNIIKIVPNLLTKTFTLKYVEAKKLLESASSASSSEAQSSTAGVLTQESTIYDLLSSKGKVFLGKQPNSIIVIDYPANIEKAEEYFKIVDQRMASRVFRLRYLKAGDVVGESSSTSTATESSTTDTTETSSTSSTSSTGS